MERWKKGLESLERISCKWEHDFEGIGDELLAKSAVVWEMVLKRRIAFSTSSASANTTSSSLSIAIIAIISCRSQSLTITNTTSRVLGMDLCVADDNNLQHMLHEVDECQPNLILQRTIMVRLHTTAMSTRSTVHEEW